MSHTVVFKFMVGQIVWHRSFKTGGIVRMGAVDREGAQYFVQFKTDTQWCPEDELTDKKEDCDE